MMIKVQKQANSSRFNRGDSQRGFAMIIVFLIMMAMVGAATTVLVATRTNVRNSGMQREKLVSRYVAEAAVAQAKAAMLTKWSSFNKWSDLLSSPPSQANHFIDYTYGGTNGLPLVKARLYFSFSNNSDDPSKNSLIDNDGKVVINAQGEILDPGSSTPKTLAISNIEVMVFKGDTATDNVGYTAQSHGNSSQTSYSGKDIQGVDFSNSTNF